MTNAIEFDVNLKVSPHSRISIGASAWAPNIRLLGRFFPGRILRCERVIAPGDEGTATLGMLVEDDVVSTISSGTLMLLCDGPSVTIAEAVVSSDGILNSEVVS